MEERQGRMIKASVSLHELRRKIYSKAKADSAGSGGVGKRSISLPESNSRPIGYRLCCEEDRKAV
jgi:hypothetical protein